jgi:hypothetical protein
VGRLAAGGFNLAQLQGVVKAEFAVENHDKLMGELLKATQKGLVGEYATDIMRYFKVLNLGEEARVRHFVRGLKFGIKETVMASRPTSFLQAVKKAKGVEQAYELSDNRPPLDGLKGRIKNQVVRAVRQGMNHFKNSNWDRNYWGDRRPDPRSEARAAPRKPARVNERPRGRSPERNPPINLPAARPPPPPARPHVNEPASGEGFNGRCPRCLQMGHRVRECPNPSTVPWNDCCGWYGKHFPGCAQATAQDRGRAPAGARPQGVLNVVLGSDPILPHSLEVQNHWMDSELFPHASCSFNLTLVSESVSGAFIWAM